MSLQGPMLVVADSPATGLVDALVAAGAFPIVETTWADPPTAFVSVNHTAVVIAEPGAPHDEAAARMLCLQIATAKGTIVPVIARVHGDQESAIPIALAADAALPVGGRSTPSSAWRWASASRCWARSAWRSPPSISTRATSRASCWETVFPR